jgi:hypothetical protein
MIACNDPDRAAQQDQVRQWLPGVDADCENLHLVKVGSRKNVFGSNKFPALFVNERPTATADSNSRHCSPSRSRDLQRFAGPNLGFASSGSGTTLCTILYA